MRKIVFEDVDFCLGVKRVVGQIVAEQGIPVFYVPKEHLIMRVPFAVSAEYYDQTFEAFIYPGCKDVLLQLGEDDILIDDLTEGDLDLLSEMDVLEAMAEEEKIRETPAIAKKFFNMFVSILALVGLVMASVVFHIEVPFIAMLGIAIVAGAIFLINLLRFISCIKFLSSTKVYDRSGRWVDLQTMETSLNGGYTIPRKENSSAL